VISKACKAFGGQVVEADSYESDDVIATLCEQAKRDGLKAIISSYDKGDVTHILLFPFGSIRLMHYLPSTLMADMFQLISDNVEVLRLNGKKTKGNEAKSVGLEEWRSQYEIEPQLMADVQALTGDTGTSRGKYSF
jgi:5'-3' exonuclease